MGKRAEILLGRIEEEIIGIEIEDTISYIDYVEEVVEEAGIPYSRSKENDVIYEIKFHAPFRDLIEIFPALIRNFTTDHPEGNRDKKAGSMHVHLTTGTIFVPSKLELIETNDLNLFDKMNDAIDALSSYMKRNDSFRDSVSLCGMASNVRKPYNTMATIRDHRASLRSGSKSSALTFNNEEARVKNETLEIRINEVFPLWIPSYFLLICGYNLHESMAILEKYREKSCYTKYMKKIYEASGFGNNTKIMKGVLK